MAAETTSVSSSDLISLSSTSGFLGPSLPPRVILVIESAPQTPLTNGSHEPIVPLSTTESPLLTSRTSCRRVADDEGRNAPHAEMSTLPPRDEKSPRPPPPPPNPSPDHAVPMRAQYLEVLTRLEKLVRKTMTGSMIAGWNPVSSIHWNTPQKLRMKVK